MKMHTTVAALVLLLSGNLYAADKHNHGDEGQPLHGGSVTEVKDIDYEFVAKSDVLQLHVRNHGKPVDISKSSAKVTLLTGVEKQEVELKPLADKLEAKGDFKIVPGMKVIAQVRIGGGVTLVRFSLK